MSPLSAIRQHYEPTDLLARIEAGLKKSGKSPETVTPDDLAPVDEFHARGAPATTELVTLLSPTPGARVLDAGSGLGGPARRLAKTTGCRVVGIDLSEEYCRTGTAFNRWLGLDGQVQLMPGDATDLGRFDASSFDAAWTIHTAMNIADKTAFYAGIARVLKPGGKLVIYDILAAGNGQDIRFPVPWARNASVSFLATIDEMSGYIAAAGFATAEIRDRTAEGIAFFDQAIARMREATAPPPLGLHLVLGPDFPAMINNLQMNLVERRLAVAILACRKAA